MDKKETAIRVLKVDSQSRFDLLKIELISEEKAIDYAMLFIKLDFNKERRMDRTR